MEIATFEAQYELVRSSRAVLLSFCRSLDASDLLKANPFKLFTHVITHEFHHQGQILPMSRQLGYIPVDTDVMR